MKQFNSIPARERIDCPMSKCWWPKSDGEYLLAPPCDKLWKRSVNECNFSVNVPEKFFVVDDNEFLFRPWPQQLLLALLLRNIIESLVNSGSDPVVLFRCRCSCLFRWWFDPACAICCCSFLSCNRANAANMAPSCPVNCSSEKERKRANQF